MSTEQTLADIAAMPNPKLNPEYIDALFGRAKCLVMKVGAKTTLVQAVFPNGFAITEHSSCVDPANYDEAMGVEIATKKIKDKLWELEGYRLQCLLAERGE